MSEQEPLERERHVYEMHLDEWRQAHLGEFVLIKDEAVVGFFGSLEAAFAAGIEKFQLEPFFVKQILPAEIVNVSFFGRQLQSA